MFPACLLSPNLGFVDYHPSSTRTLHSLSLQQVQDVWVWLSHREQQRRDGVGQGQEPGRGAEHQKQV